MKWKSLITSLSTVLMMTSLPAYANPITTIWRITSLSQYDYASGKYETPSVPTNFDLIVTFPLEVTRAVDYGTTTITYFGEIGATKFVSPLTNYVGTDPFGSGLTNQIAYTFPNVSDYASTFLEEFAAQSNAYSPSGEKSWAYHIELRVRRYTESRGGTGAADYAFTGPMLTKFLEDVMTNPLDYSFIFNESWQVYDGAANEYLAGKSWSSYNQNVRLVGLSIPEPTVVTLLGIGLVWLSLMRHSRSVSK